MTNSCPNPSVLRSGIVVPCGKCEICRSNNRLEWQYRLRIHLKYCNNMPMFVTLTYDDAHLPMIDGVPTVYRPDFSQFLKAYKRKYGLTNDKFQYFGCSEYGDLFGRPHGHLLLFGDDALYQAFMKDSSLANKRIEDVWQRGHVDVGIAGYDGMAYVTKYVLKANPADYEGPANRPFTIASKGLGMNYLNSPECRNQKRILASLTKSFDEIYSRSPAIDFRSRSSVLKAISFWQQYVPSLITVLDDGSTVFLPRAIRKKLVGTFEHFKDNPLWVLNSLKTYLESMNYYSSNGDYDKLHELSYSMECSFAKIRKMHINGNIRNYNKLQEKLSKYETV